MPEHQIADAFRARIQQAKQTPQGNAAASFRARIEQARVPEPVVSPLELGQVPQELLAQQDVTRVAPPPLPTPDPAFLESGRALLGTSLPRLTVPSEPEPPGPEQFFAKPASTAVAGFEQPPAPPSIRAASPKDILGARIALAKEADTAQLQERFEKIPGPVRVAGAGVRGFGNAITLGRIDELVTGTNKLLAKAVGTDAPTLSSDEILNIVERGSAEKIAEIIGFVGGAGLGISATNKLIARIAPLASKGSKTRALLESFNPAVPASVGVRAAQGAVEGLPFDLAFEADTPADRIRNVGLGLVLGALLGPVVGGRTGKAESVEGLRVDAPDVPVRAPEPAPDVPALLPDEITTPGQRAQASVQAQLRTITESGKPMPEPDVIGDMFRNALEIEGRTAPVRDVPAQAVDEAPLAQVVEPVATPAEGVLSESPVNVDAVLAERSLTGIRRDEGTIAVGKPLLPGQGLDIPKRDQIVADISNTLNVPVRVGRFSGGARGIFKIQPEVIRSRVALDVENVAHEAGHSLQKVLFGTAGKNGGLVEAPLKPWANELLPLAQGISDESLAEGYAEFVRRYLTNPESAQLQAPQFLKFFEETLEGRMPEALGMLRRARDDYRLWREAPAQARIQSQIARPEDSKPELFAEGTWRKLRTAAIDDLTPLRHAVKQATGKVEPKDLALDAGTLADLARGSAGQAEVMIEDGMLDFGTRNIVGRPLKEVFDPIRREGGKLEPEDYDAWVRYAVARRVEYLYASRDDVRFLGIERGDAQQTIRELDSPEFKEALDRYQEFNDGQLRWLRDSGVLSDESYAAIKATNEVYVPLMRAIDKGQPLGSGGRSLVNRQNPIRRIKGSGRPILDPGEVTLERTYQYTRLAAKQQVSNAIVKLSQQPGMGHLVEAIPVPLRPFNVSVGETLDQLLGSEGRAALKDVPDEVKAEMLTFFQPGDYAAADNVISVIQNGKRKFFEVEPELFKALEGVDQEEVQWWAKIFGAPARTLRAGATLAPEFGLRNPFRDQVMAFIQSDYGFIPGVDLVQGMASILKRDDYATAFKAGGAARAALVGIDRKAISRNFRRSMGVENVITNPMDALRAFSELMENATRVGESRKALIALRAQGVPEGVAVQRAAKAGREVSVDFARGGSKTKAFRLMTAFWNARIQGYDRLFREFKKNPQRTTARATAIITVPSVLEYMVNRDDPEYFELPRWQRSLFWMIKSPSGQWWRFPKPFELGFVFGTIPQLILEWMDQNDPQGFNAAAKDFLAGEAMGFVPIPTFAQPLIDNYANFNTFLGRPIVPRGLESVDPEEQYTRGTSGVSKQLGRMLNVSPAKLDNLIYSYTGGLGRLALQTVDFAAETAGIAEDDVDTRPLALKIPGLRGFAAATPGRSSESIELLYRLRDRANRAKATYDKLKRDGRFEKAEEYYSENEDLILMRTRLNRTTTDLSQLRKTVRATQSSIAIPLEERVTRIRDLERIMTNLAAAALGRPGLTKFAGGN